MSEQPPVTLVEPHTSFLLRSSPHFLDSFTHELPGAVLVENFTGACSSMQCEDNYMCDIQDGIAFCIISECPEESLFYNATATSELRGVGDVRQYVCSNEVAEKSRRQPYAVCQEGGSWKLSDHSCQIPTGCSDVARSGVYDIRPVHSPTLSVYCDAETDGGGWTVIQRRMDGSVDFFKFWYDYKHGFGDISREFWLGNDILSALTKQGEYELRIDMEAFDGEKRFAHYDHFAVADELTHFTLKVGNFSGDAGDSFGVCDGMKFSTRDLDNDVSSLTHENCADRYKGGWWYGACHHANLNGMYLAGDYFGGDPIGITWLTWKGFHYSLKRTEMKIRRKSVNRAPPSS
ncbi:hypothetical protein ScPMuIL_010794 [Solemya velum]